MKRIGTLAAAVALTSLLGGIGAGANAASVVDQSFLSVSSSFTIGQVYPPSLNNFNYAGVGQSFTAGMAGELTGIDVYFGQSALTGTVTVQLWDGVTFAANKLLGTLTYTTPPNFGTVSTPSATNGTHFDFSSFNITSIANHLYAFTISTTGGGTASLLDHSLQNPTYAAGGAYYAGATAPATWTSMNWDLAFQTYVDQPAATPLPAALPLFGGGLLLVGMFARRRARANGANA